MLGEALRLIRVFHDVKLNELAEQLNVSKGYISEIESQKKKPSLDLIEKYSKRFKISTSAIMLFSEELDKDRSDLKIGIRNKILKFLQIVEHITINNDVKK